MKEFFRTTIISIKPMEKLIIMLQAMLMSLILFGLGYGYAFLEVEGMENSLLVGIGLITFSIINLFAVGYILNKRHRA